MKRQKYDVTQHSTVTVNLSDDQDLTLLLATAGAGGYTVTFSGVNKWISPTGSAPTQPTAVGTAAEWVFFRANGTTYGEKTSETGPAGSAGSAGPAGITWRRTYDSANSYALNDAVYYSGSSYIALQASSSTNAQQPDQATAYWGALASGSTGGGSSSDTVDQFIRANNANISTGAPFAYTVNAGTLSILSNQLAVSTTTHAYARATGAVPTSADQHCQVTLGAITINGTDNVQWGPTIRNDAAGAATRYEADIKTVGTWFIRLHSLVAGVDSILTQVGVASAPVAGDTMKLAAVGSTITVYYNGVQKIQVTDTAVDGTTVGGKQCGCHMVEGTANVQVALAELRFGS